MAMFFNRTGKYRKAVEEFQRSTAIGGCAAKKHCAGWLTPTPTWEIFAAAEATYKKAIALRPNYWGVYSWLGVFYYNQSRYAERCRDVP